MFAARAYIWYIITIIIIFGLYQIKYSVISLENELKQINHKIIQTQEALHTLKAEWTILNHPERLEMLNEKYIHLQAIERQQIQEIESIPLQDE